MKRVLCLFTTRPAIVELTPVLRALDARRERIATRHVAASPRAELLQLFARDVGMRVDHDLPLAETCQSAAEIVSSVLASLDPLFESEPIQLLLVQGETSAALAVALGAFLRGIPVAYLEADASVRAGAQPSPEAFHHRLIAHLASLHFAPTQGSGDSGERIADALERFLAARSARARDADPSPGAARSLANFVAAAKQCVVEIPPEEARRILDAPDREGWSFVDVREPDEYAEGHVPGARSFPRGFLEVRADLEHYKRDAWLADRSRKLILYCGGGHRSALAAQTLRQMGFQRVVSMSEGWTGWTQRDYPQE